MVTHRQRVDNLLIIIKLDDRYGIGLFIITAEFGSNLIKSHPARARLRQDKLPRAYIECAPTDLAFDIGFAGSGRYNKKRVCDILDVTDSWCAVQDSNL